MTIYGSNLVRWPLSSSCVGVAVIVMNDHGKYLLHQGTFMEWCLLGGIPKPGMSQEEAARYFVEQATGGFNIQTLHMHKIIHGKRLFPLESEQLKDGYFISVVYLSKPKVMMEDADQLSDCFFDVNHLPFALMPQIKDLLIQHKLNTFRNYQ